MKLIAPIHFEKQSNYRLFLDTVHRILSGGISFSDNMNGESYFIVLGGVASPTTITHKLGRVPTGILVLGQDRPGHVVTVSMDKDKVVLYSDSIFMQATIFIVGS